jgi:dephospho-CoA kinase
MLLIVGITGMPGAGKSTAAEVLVAKGWKRIAMGNMVREETRRRGLEPDLRNTGEVMTELRREHGESAIADLCLAVIEEKSWKKVVVDGIRSTSEIEAFRRKASVIVIAVHASATRRFELLGKRRRRDDPLTEEMFHQRDARELAIGIGSAIALADEVISNQQSTPTELASEIIDIVERWTRKRSARVG